MNRVLSVNNVSKRVKDFQILNKVSFELERGEIVGLIGPNGAGKTSIMKILVGLTRNYTGEVDLSGVRDIGCMIETPSFYPYNTGYQNLMYFAGLNKKKNITVLISSHLLGELEKMCDRAIIIKKGEVIQFMDFCDDKKERQITYVMESPDAKAARKILQENKYRVVSQNEREVRIRIDAGEKIDVVKLLMSHHVVMTGLYEASETLEDTFLELMKN